MTPKKQVSRHKRVSLSPKESVGHFYTHVLVLLSPYNDGLKGHVQTHLFVESSAYVLVSTEPTVTLGQLAEHVLDTLSA